MTRKRPDQTVFLVLTPLIFGFLFLFYLKYVPLVRGFQIVLLPLLLGVIATAAIRIRSGILLFVFLFPLTNSLPYFFGIDLSIPHSPVALVLCLGLIAGWTLHRALDTSKTPEHHNPPDIFLPLFVWFLIVLISTLITCWRFSNFFPILSDRVHEVFANTKGVTAGGAIMSSLFSGLNYLTAMVLFVIVMQAADSRVFRKRLLITLCLSATLAASFGLVQMGHSPQIGNTAFWIKLGQINATFKDPNSGAAFFAAFLPVLAGLIWVSKGRRRIPLALLAGLILFVFPAVGSRSGLLALSIATLALLAVIVSRKNKKRAKQIITLVLVCLVLAVIIVSATGVLHRSILFQRIRKNIELVKGQDMDEAAWNTLFTRKLEFWRAAKTMFIRHPATGIGTGAYIVELPNVLKEQGRPYRYADSAENYFIQIGAETGLLGIAVLFWLFGAMARRLWLNGRAGPADAPEKKLLLGVAGGLLAFLVSFLFHSYVGAFDAHYFFWLLAAVGVSLQNITEGTPDEKKWPRKTVRLMLLLPFFFGAIQFWDSLTRLSLPAFSKKFGIQQEYGLFSRETDERGYVFRWTKRFAGLAVENMGSTLFMPLLANHPDIARDPVKVKIYQGNEFFKKKKLLKEAVLRNHDWQGVELSVSRAEGEWCYLVLETNRDWQPLKFSGLPDARKLAVAIGQPYFVYPKDIPGHKIIARRSIRPASWQGRQGALLYHSGTAAIRFRADSPDFALRLRLKGQRAYGLGPMALISLDGVVIAKTRIQSEDWTSLVLEPRVGAGEHLLEVAFNDDLFNPADHQDRNLRLGALDILSVRTAPD